MASHTGLVGYGRRGHQVLRELTGLRFTSTVVLDRDLACAVQAAQDGTRPVIGDGTDVMTLREAGVPLADRVVVTVADEVAALRVVSAVRWLNYSATVAGVLHEPRRRDLALYLGADQVVVSDASLASLAHDRVSLRAIELLVVERAVTADEVGRCLSACAPTVPAAFRGGRRLWRDLPDPPVLHTGDRLIELRAHSS